MSTATAVINVDIEGPTISRHLYGHFAEHLGRCVYGGFWVGEDSPVPNEGGIRLDVVEALRALDIPNQRWPGGCFPRPFDAMTVDDRGLVLTLPPHSFLTVQAVLA